MDKYDSYKSRREFDKRIVITDSDIFTHPRAMIVAEGFAKRAVISSHLKSRDFEICQAVDIKEDWRHIYQLVHPDILVINIMPDIELGLHNIRALQKSNPEAKFVVATDMHYDFVSAIIKRNSINGYYVYNSNANELANTCMQALDGDRFVWKSYEITYLPVD